MKHIKKFNEEFLGIGKSPRKYFHKFGSKFKIGDYLECIDDYKWLVTLFDTQYASDTGNYDSFLDKLKNKNRYLFNKGNKYKIVNVVGRNGHEMVTLESDDSGKLETQIFTVGERRDSIGVRDNFFPVLEQYFKID